ncbi:MAG: dipeptidase [Burkholderiales bacterium]
MSRRSFVGGLAGLAAGSLLPPLPTLAQPRRLPDGPPPPGLRWADMHSHHGMVPAKRNAQRTRLADDMRASGLAVVAMKVIADYPVLAYSPGRIVAREARANGQFRAHFEHSVAALKARAAREGLDLVTAPGHVERALTAQRPAIAIAAEGADFLEGDLAYLDQAKAMGLAHLQLLHFRVNECGDTANLAPVHGGLSDFGRDVVRACNRLGILVDVAHCSQRGIVQALEVSSRPLIYSHGWVSANEPQWEARNARAIHAPLAQAIAKAGGVVGVFPIQRDIAAYAAALHELTAAVGEDHAGIGLDIDGLGRSALPTYAGLPALAQALEGLGMREAAVDKLMGGNYLRVLRRALDP